MFLTEWEYDGHLEHDGRVYHVWCCQHHEGYAAYALTHQSKTGFIKPQGTGHFVSLDPLVKIGYRQ